MARSATGRDHARRLGPDWLPTRHDLRATIWARLETTIERQVLPRFGPVPLRRITNSEVRGWVRDLLAQGLSAATVRKAVFALRQCLTGAVADGRLTTNPADSVPLPTERPHTARYLSQPEVERLVAAMPRRYQALILVGAYAGLRWGEAAGLRRRDLDPLRSRIRITGTAVQIPRVVTLDTVQLFSGPADANEWRGANERNMDGDLPIVADANQSRVGARPPHSSSIWSPVRPSSTPSASLRDSLRSRLTFEPKTKDPPVIGEAEMEWSTVILS